MPAANTRACFDEVIGHQVVGVLFDALPINRHVLVRGTKTLILDDGRGLTISGSGSYWLESVEDIRRAVAQQRQELEAASHRLRGVLALAGEGAPDA